MSKQNVSMYAPWYVVVWRALWIIPLYVSRILFILFVFIAYGKNYAKDVIRNTR